VVLLGCLSRGGQVARALLGAAVADIVITDRWSAYYGYPGRWRQLRGAHLLRDIEAMIGRGGRFQEIGEALQSHGRQRFSWWHRVRDGPLQRSRFRSVRSPLRREVEQWLEAGGTCGTSKTEGVCRASLKLRPALWTRVPLEGVEPPNNAAEQAMGPRVLWRKCSCGTQSVQGSRLVETLMTVVAPLKQ
jgi:transposase